MRQSHPMGFLSVKQRFRNLGAIALTGEPITITNCIIRDNGPWPIGPGITVHYSNVEGRYEGVGNIDADPCFVDPGYAINWPELWVSGDYHLQSQAGRYDPNTQTWVQDPNTSPCIDAGDPGYGAGSGETDLDGRPRVIGGRIDMGAYEFQPPRTLYVDADAAGANDGTSWQDAYFYLQDALMFAVVGDEIHMAQGIYRPDDFVLSDRPSLGRAETFQLINGVTLKGGYAGLGEPDPNARDIELYETILSGDLDGNDIDIANPEDLLDEPTRAENSYHVVTGSGTGETAVLDGFTISAGYARGYFDRNDPRLRGGGMYNLECDATVIGCVFRENTAMYGGGVYNDISNPAFTECSFVRNLADTDYPHWSGSGGGMYNFPSCFTKLSACVFRENYASRGGGLSGYLSPIELVGCTFIGNVAEYGGGMVGGSTLTNCAFIRNSASIAGGAIVSDSPTMKGCTFIENTASRGGAVCFSDEDASPTVINCIFRANLATRSGGGIYLYGMSTFTECTFSLNSAKRGGGVFYADGAYPTLTNCTFITNSAEEEGGAMYSEHSGPILTNCIVSSNSARRGGGIYNKGSSTTALVNCTFAANSGSEGNAIAFDSYPQRPSTIGVTNCILWDGGDEIWNNDGSTITITYSDVQGSWPGEGNIDTDPCFADADNYDYHLKSQGGRYDPVTQAWVYDGVTSPCIDTGNPMLPIGYEPFPNGGIINMGAYGGTAEASKSYFGKPPCEIIVAGDINGDCEVNFLDFSLMALHWMEEH